MNKSKIDSYKYFKYWLEILKHINMSKIILEKIIEEYQKTKDIKYLEYTLENIKEISRLISLATDNHEKAFNSTTT